MSRKLEIELERRIVGQVVDDALAAGYGMGIDCDGEYVLSYSTDRKEVLDVLFDVDEAYLYVYLTGLDYAEAPHKRSPEGWVRFTFGNVEAVITDYTTNLESLLTNANKIAEEYRD